MNNWQLRSELYVSTVYCPRANPSVELIDGLYENRDQITLTGDFNSKHPGFFLFIYLFFYYIYYILLYLFIYYLIDILYILAI